MKRAQGSVELLIILGVALAVLLAVFGVSNKTTNFKGNEFEIAKSRSAISDLANAAELVYKQGVGSKTKLYVNFPKNVNNITFSGKTILLNVDVSGGRDVYRSVNFNVRNGSIASPEDRKLIYVIAGENFVYFTDNISEEAELCGNNFQEGKEDCDSEDLNSNTCFIQGYDDGNISCKLICKFNFTECTGSGTIPDSITNLANLSADAYTIYWTWTNPSNLDFNTNIIYINGVNVANTSNAFYTATNLVPSTNNTIVVHTADYGPNINDTNVSNTAGTESRMYVGSVPLQQCNSEDDVAKGTLNESCDGNYPGKCDASNDLLSCNDGNSETHIATKEGGSWYAGVNLTIYNSSINDCVSIDTVLVCYEWWNTDALQDCDISVDADGGSSYTAVTTTCPGTTSNPGVSCIDVTGSETWTCLSFFNTTGTKAIIKSEAQHSGGAGTRTITWDALYYNVTYSVI